MINQNDQGNNIKLQQKQMGLQIESEIFKWLQNLKLAREGKRTPEGKIQLPETVTGKLYDGVLIGQIAKSILKHSGEEEMAIKLAAIRENSTPAIRLYNWNILAEALKKLGYTIDYSEKSKLLNLQNEALIKVIKHLWSLRVEENLTSGSLAVSIKEVGGRTLREAANVFELLVISISNNFKLSVPHSLNLFLDNNKYLAHLLVKGVKGTYDPVLMMLRDCRQNLGFIVDSLLCVDEKESFDLLLGALKPCLISKEVAVAESCLSFLKELCEIYLEKGLSLEVCCSWMERQGFDTIFFSIKRHPTLFAESLAVAYAYMDDKLFKKLQPEDKSLLWSNESERLTFYRQFIDQAHTHLVQKFIADPVFHQWNKLCLRSLKKAHTSTQLYDLLTLLQKLWSAHPIPFEKSSLNLPTVYSAFLKNCTLSTFEIVFIESTRILFTLIVRLGEDKNQYAPLLYKAAVSSLTLMENEDHIEFALQSFMQIMKDIPTLPAAPLAKPLLRFLDLTPSTVLLGMVKIVLVEGRIRELEKQELEESLVKIIFLDIQHSELAQEILIDHLKQVQNSQPLEQYCSAALAQFFSIAREVNRPLKELKLDFHRYSQEDSPRRGEPSFVRNIKKFLILENIVTFLQKALLASSNCKEQIESHIFHTYIRIERELKREHVSRLLMPLMRSYYDEDELPAKLEEYLQETRPSALNLESINHESPSASPLAASKKFSRLKTQQIKKSNRINSVSKDLDLIKQKRDQEKERSMLQQKQKQVEEQKKSLFFSIINEKRIVQYGKSREPDVDYKFLQEFDSVKPTERQYGVFDMQLLNLQVEEEVSYIDDVMAVMKKYRKLWRFLFFKYSSFGIKGSTENQHPQEKISVADITKFLKDYDIQLLSKDKNLQLVKRVNETQKKKNDPSNLTYLGFEEYILQFCYLGYKKKYPCNPPGRQIMKLINHIRQVTASRGGSVQMFDSPQEMYFQETDIIREFNLRLSQNPDYPLPEGYKKIRQTQYQFNYTVTEMQKGINKNRAEVVEVLDDILFNSLGFRMLEPLTTFEEKCLARPVLFQKIKEKMKDYHAGYLLPKKSAYLPRIEKETSPTKVEYHLPIAFSFGIKMGIANTDPKFRIVAEEVAYWLDDALDSIETGNQKVGNKSKTRIQNELMRRKRSQNLEFRIQKQEQEKKQRSRASTLKHKTVKFNEDKKELQKKAREDMKLQRLRRKQKQKRMMDKKKIEYQQAVNKLQAKRREVEEKKEAELQLKKKEHVTYKKNVEQYFKKKKEELEEQEKSVRANKEYAKEQEEEKKVKAEKQKRKVEIAVFKKQETVLEKLSSAKESYDEAWKEEEIQQEMQNYRLGLKLMFDLLIKYEKSKISTTGPGEISQATFNFYVLRSRIMPLIVNKNSLAILFKSMCKSEKNNGINLTQFEQLLFKIVVKGKDVLNSRKTEDEEEFELGDSDLPIPRNSVDLSLSRRKSLTEEYAIDATGVTSMTVKKLMEYLDLPDDKQEAEQSFRKLLERTSSKPMSLQLKQARSMLESTVI